MRCEECQIQERSARSYIRIRFKQKTLIKPTFSDALVVAHFLLLALAVMYCLFLLMW